MKSVAFCLLFCVLTTTFACNVDTTFSINFTKDPGSYFGFSVAFHENSEGNMVLIGAPRANSTYISRKQLYQPGVLYKCNITTTVCEEIVLNRLANEASQNTVSTSYHALENDSWLGVSLDVHPVEGNIVTCGHLWKNQFYKLHYLTNGICYLMDKDMKKTKIKKLLPFIEREKQSLDGTEIYYYAFAQLGMSAAFSEDGRNLLLGSPGFYDWIGTVINYLIPEDYRYIKPPIIPDPPGDQNINPEAYMGYSVTSGNFFEIGELQFVTGAPRDGNYKGRIYIFEELTLNRSKIIVLQKKEGTQIGEYFGAYVLGVDVNNDNFTDLLVGAPLYSHPYGCDEGKVYVYISNGKGLERTEDLLGSKSSQGRFGTTIANAGDINQDGYTDVAIGAPYEDGNGAVYIYEGNSVGINSQFSQRITAEEIASTLSGFGMSISRGKDIDLNNYPDLLIGSYDSGHAVLLRTRPIVRISAIIKFYPNQINTNSSFCKFDKEVVPCFNTSYCLIYTGNHVPSTLDVSIQLSSSRQRDMSKLLRYLEYRGNLLASLQQNVTVNVNTERCFFVPTYIMEDKDDLITPINMNLKFWLTHNISNEVEFCKTCPILDPSASNPVNQIITFQTGCREGTTCISDLIVKANVTDDFGADGLTLGRDKVISISIQVKNLKEPAYLTEMQIFLPDQVQVINSDKCNSHDEHKNKVLFCNVGNPLKSDRIAKYNIKLDTSQISNELHELVLMFSVTTASVEENPKDNNATMIIPLAVSADITIAGVAEKEQIVFGKEQNEMKFVDFDHYYTVSKFLPSTINSVSTELSIPTTFLHTNITFLQLTSIQINEGQEEAVPASCNVTRINLKPENAGYEKNKELTLESDTFGLSVDINRPRRSLKNSEVSQTESLTTIKSEHYINYALNCTTSVCERIVCAAGPFTNKKSSANFHIKGRIDISVLQNNLKKWDNITIMTEGKVVIKDQRRDIQPTKHHPDTATVTTTLVQTGALPAKKLPTWILAVSIAAGILLLLIILLGLIKFGFFKRKKKEEMEQIITQDMLEEWDPYLISDEEVEKAVEAYMNRPSCESHD